MLHTYDLTSHTFKADPHPTYAALRQEAPLCQHAEANGNRFWLVTRYADAVAVSRAHHHFVKNYRNTLTATERAQLPLESSFEQMLNSHMLNQDGADHARLRGLVNKAFGARNVNQLRSRIQMIADGLLDQVQAAGQMELLEAFALPLPITVIAELLGIPPADHNQFRVFSNAFISSAQTAEEQMQQGQVIMDFIAYLGQLFAERRHSPQADLITALLQAEEAGESLSEEELYSMVILLIVAGHETTVNLIGNGILTLLQHPAHWASLRADPSLIPAAVEELLRYDGPIDHSTARYAAEDVEIGGQCIHRGEQVVISRTAINRDPAQFAEPETLDFHRPENRHLSFGLGVHYCLGAALARLEMEVALHTLLRRMPNLRLTVPVATLTWRQVALLRGLERLPVSW
jgi:cytochrome P450